MRARDKASDMRNIHRISIRRQTGERDSAQSVFYNSFLSEFCFFSFLLLDGNGNSDRNNIGIHTLSDVMLFIYLNVYVMQRNLHIRKHRQIVHTASIGIASIYLNDDSFAPSLSQYQYLSVDWINVISM